MKIKPFDKKETQAYIKYMQKNKTDLRKLKVGDFSFFDYNPKDKKQAYDKHPLILILKISKGYILGINFNWIPMKYRVELLAYILKLNTDNGKLNKNIVFPYKKLKKFLISRPYKYCLRLYIRKRMSQNGIILPSNSIVNVCRLELGRIVNFNK